MGRPGGVSSPFGDIRLIYDKTRADTVRCAPSVLCARALNAALQHALARPFALDRPQDYLRWRERKLAAYPRRAEDLIVEVRDPRKLTDAETEELRRVCAAANMAVYASPLAGLADKDLVRRVGARLGLERLQGNPFADEDGISSLETAPEKSARGYIPYSSRRLLWHTDGYYNPQAQRIRAFILHCVRAAASGGENRVLDHEIAYLLLRDADPEHVRALSAPDAMTIPANTGEGMQPRPAQSGPVFSSDAGALHMRYTARTRSIEWRADEATRAAVRRLSQILEAASPYVFTLRLAPGQGLVCNNVLHDRSAFTDAPGAGRLVYRARYRDRIGDRFAAP
jgi:alpha-ketoglutarate-dependent taurine dioxygenase